MKEFASHAIVRPRALALVTQREGRDGYGTPIDSLERGYVELLADLGHAAVPVPNEVRSAESLLSVGAQLLLLTGGGGVRPSYYDVPGLGGDQPRRDEAEGLLFDAFVEAGLPVLCICRGFQFANGRLGGRVSKLGDAERHPPRVDHPVLVSDRLGVLETDEMAVNSFHNDAIREAGLARELVPLATEPSSGVVEAAHAPGMRLLCFQWHPERHFSDRLGRAWSYAAIRRLLEGDL